MSKQNSVLFFGFIFVSILGTLAHFVYEWSGYNPAIGFIAPVNESIWEHMKLVLFPALLYIPIASYFLKDDYPYIAQAMAYGILAGTLFLPVFFYSYSGILGYQIMPLDIGSFFIAVAIVFTITYKLAAQNVPLGNTGLVLLAGLALLFVIFSYNPPTLGIFEDYPRESK